MNNPSLTREKYLRILEEKKEQIKKPINMIKDIELKNLNKQIDLLHRMELLLNPSPISYEEEKIKVEIPMSAKNITMKTVKTKIFGRCPEGKERNPVTKRCKKERKINLNISSQKTKKNLPCSEGKERNPETGRCKNIKIYPPCSEGKIRGPITNRCKKQE